MSRSYRALVLGFHSPHSVELGGLVNNEKELLVELCHRLGVLGYSGEDGGF